MRMIICILTDMVPLWKTQRLLLHVSMKHLLCSKHSEFKELWFNVLGLILQSLYCQTQLHCLFCYSAALGASQYKSIWSLHQILSEIMK